MKVDSGWAVKTGLLAAEEKKSKGEGLGFRL